MSQEIDVRLSDDQTSDRETLHTQIGQLLKQYDWTPVRLGTIATITRGGNFQKKDFIESGKPCIHYGQIYTHFGVFTDEPLTFVNDAIFEKSKKAKPGDIVMAVTSENVEDVCSCTAWLGDEDLAVSGHTAIISHHQEPKFLSYYFHSADFFKQKKKLAHGTKVIEVTPSQLNDIVIPLPPRPVQREIVRILDNFTLLTAELTAELTARKKQYEYYRDALLRFDSAESTAPTKFLSRLLVQHCPNGVEYKALGESAAIVRGASPRPIRKFITTESTGVNWIKIGDVKPGDKYITASAEKITQEGAKKSRAVKKGDFILSNSMSFGRPYILKIDGCIHDGWLAISDFSDSYLPDFLYYLLNSNSCQSEMRKRASFGGAVQNLNADIVRALVLPVPPLPVQKEIVAILDRFDTLCHDITQGLPAEIEARKKQYEYYRDRLLRLPPAAK